MDADILIAVGGVLTAAAGVVAAFVTLFNARKSARKDELALLRDEVGRLADRQAKSDARIDELMAENTKLHREVSVLRAYNYTLVAILRMHNIEVPPMPRLEAADCPPEAETGT